jgi:uncharacterized Ntn-hydrolase superfamily protein
MREAVVDAKVAVAEIQEAIARTDRELGLERQRLADAERRGRLAGEIQDQETVTVAERFTAKHRERIAVLQHKLAAQREELALAERELEEMHTQLKSAERDRPAMQGERSTEQAWRDVQGAGGARPGMDLEDELLKSDLDRAGREAAAARQLEELKKKMRKGLTTVLLLVLLQNLQQPPQPPPPDFLKRAHTYSIVAYDSVTGDLGIAVQSKFPNVGGLVPWARAGVGAVATQSLSNTDYGEKGLELIARGATAPEAMRIIMRSDTRPSQRQVGMVDAHGNAASWTGDSTFDWAGGKTGGRTDGQTGGKGQLITGRGYAAQANIMVSDATVRNMADTFERTQGSLADRLIAALVAGQAGGGDRRGMQSAALLVVRANAGYLGTTDRYIDIRVYDAPDPIKELQRLYALHKLYFFTTDSADLLPITPALQKELEAILLVEPVNQPQKWLAAPQPSLNDTFLTALANFMYWENYDVRVRMDGRIDRVALDDIRKNRKRR